MAAAADFSSRLVPDRAGAAELAREHNVVPVRLSVTDDCETPVSALLKLREGGPCFLLESAERGQVGRYSFIGTRPRSVLRWSDGVLREFPGTAMGPDAEVQEEIDAPDPYRAVADYMDRFDVAEVPGLPPFAGGAVGQR